MPQPWGPWCRGILFRKTYGELEELIQRSQEIYPPWFPGCRWVGTSTTGVSHAWIWPNGATLKMRYLEHADDWMRYWGHQYTWIGWDELPSWPSLTAYHKMMARLRSAHAVPNKRVRSTGNPGGPGHQAVKAYFGIDLNPNGGQIMKDPTTGMSRMFIKSRVQDNHILLEHDPGYIDRLRGLGSDALVKAWLEGDWNVVAGAFFDCWSTLKHVVHPFAIPAHWMRFGSFDWGSARPFSYGLWAVSDGSTLPDERRYPSGALIRYREWYGASSPNVGLKLTAEQVADGIAALERSDRISYRVADPACFKVDGGPSHAERMAVQAKIIFRPADNARVAGWDQMRNRLLGVDGEPMLYVFDTCADFIRTVPALQHDEDKLEDVNSDSEDHAGDECRYACQSRPFTRKAPVETPVRGIHDITMNEVWKAQRKPNQGGRI